MSLFLAQKTEILMILETSANMWINSMLLVCIEMINSVDYFHSFL